MNCECGTSNIINCTSIDHICVCVEIHPEFCKSKYDHDCVGFIFPNTCKCIECIEFVREQINSRNNDYPRDNADDFPNDSLVYALHNTCDRICNYILKITKFYV